MRAIIFAGCTVFLLDSIDRILRVASNPSMTGIERSVGGAMSEVKQEYFRMNASGKTKTERTLNAHPSRYIDIHRGFL